VLEASLRLTPVETGVEVLDEPLADVCFPRRKLHPLKGFVGRGLLKSCKENTEVENEASKLFH